MINPPAASPDSTPLSRDDPLSGQWRNQWGSRLTLHTDGTGGLAGTFVSGTIPAAGPVPVSGSYDPAPFRSGSVLGLVVDWTETHSVTVWSGQYDPDDDVIRATWLMTTPTVGGERWRSTVIGHDTFIREA